MTGGGRPDFVFVPFTIMLVFILAESVKPIVERQTGNC